MLCPTWWASASSPEYCLTVRTPGNSAASFPRYSPAFHPIQQRSRRARPDLHALPFREPCGQQQLLLWILTESFLHADASHNDADHSPVWSQHQVHHSDHLFFRRVHRPATKVPTSYIPVMHRRYPPYYSCSSTQEQH